MSESYINDLEVSLIESNSFYKSVFENSSAAMVILEADTTIDMVNNAFCKLSGYTKEELVGTSWVERMPPEEQKRLLAYNQARLKGIKDIPNEYELKFVSKQGQKGYALVSVTLLENTRQFVVTFFDITKRKDAERKYRRSEKRYRAMVEYASDIVYSINIDGKFIYVSPNLTEQVGYTVDEVLGKSFETFVHPDDIERLKSYVQRSFETGEKISGIEYRFKRKSGEWVWYSSSSAPMIDDPNQVDSVIGIAHNIDKSKKAELKIRAQQAKLEIAMKLAKLGAWEYDSKENLFHFNDTFYSIFKTSAKEVGKLTMSPEEYTLRFVHPDDYNIVGEKMKSLLEDLGPFASVQMEHKIIYATGETGFIAVRLVVMKDESGVITKIFGINMDITAQKRAEMELREQAEQLKELNTTKDKFFSIIAHDLRSPFNSILGLSELLKESSESNVDPKLKAMASDIYKSSQLAVDLISNLIDWSRSESRRISFEPKELGLKKFIEDLLHLFTPALMEKKIELKFSISENMKVFADRDMLGTIFRNLVSNAIKYTNLNGKIFIVAENLKDSILIKVGDTGIGISPENIDKLFRLDESFSTPGTRQEQGTGLGLILCREFVEKHGGEINVKSTEGEGTEFYFTLPVKS